MKEHLRVLFIEDDLVDQMAFKRFIKREKLPYDCEICGSVAAARKALCTKPFDIVLTDHSLGDGTAFDLFGDIGDIPFIVITGSGNEEVAVKAMSAGATDYLIKDPDCNYFVTLPTTIISALEHKQSETELIRHREHLEELVKERTDELTRTNIELRQSEEKFRLITENSIDCIWTLDTKLRFTYISPSVEIILGFKPEQVVGTNVSSYFTKKEFLKVGGLAAKAITNYKTFTDVTFEAKMLNSKSEEVDIEISSKVLLNRQGKLIGLQGTTQDITERKRTDRALSEANNIINRSPAVAFLWKNEEGWPVEFVSENVENIFGYSAQEFLGGKIFYRDIIHRDDLERVTGEVASNSKKKGLQTIAHDPYKIITKKGDIKWVEDKCYIRRDSRGIITHYEGIIYDITKRVQTQHEKEMLLELSRQANAEPNLDDLLFFIVNQIVEVIPPAEASSIFLYDEKRKVVRVRAWAGFNDSEIEGLEFSIDGHQVSNIFHAKKPVLIKDVSKDPEFELIDKPSLKITRSQIAVPLIYKKQIIGIIYADNLTKADAFSQKNLDFLESIGNQLAGAIENARLLENIRQSKERYQSVADDSPGLINRFTPDGTITFVNQESCKFFGKTYQELIGTNIRSVIPEEDRESVTSNVASLTKESPMLVFENKVIKYSGEIRWIRWTNRALFDDKEQKTSIQSFGEDITKIKQAQDKEQQHLQSIAFLSKTAMQFVDFPPENDIYHFIGEQISELAGGSIVVVNSIDNAKGILTTRAVVGMGIYAKDIIKLTARNPKGMEYDANNENLAYLNDGKLHDYKEGLYGIFLGTVPKPACNTIEKLFRLNKIYTMGFLQSKRLFGTAAIFLPQGVELENKETIKLFVEQASIAIQRRQAEQALHQEQDKAQKYLDIAEVIMLVLNKKGEITLINHKGNQILGYQEGELIGANWFETCLPEKDKHKVKQFFNKTMAGEIKPDEYYENPVLTKSGGERIVGWHRSFIQDEKGHNIGLLNSGEDITKRVRTEQLLNALNRAAVAMGTAQTQEEIFNAVAEEIEQIGISCMLFPLDQTQDKLFTKYMSFESALLSAFENLLGVEHEDFSFLIEVADEYREVIREKRTVFIENPEQMLRQVFSKLSKKLLTQIIKTLRVQRHIFAPIIVDDQVIGLFSIQSDTLTREDVPTATAFADQLSSAWNKIGLLQNLRKTVEGTIHAIAATVEARDPYTAGHQTRVADLAAAIAREMHLSEDQVEGIKMAGIIHDLGKINVPAEILSKPGKLIDLEFQIIQTHPQVGYDLLKNIEFPWPIAEMVLQHHEKMDGSGYPQGLKGSDILLEARILCVADIVEAMSSHRPYRPALGIEKALAQIKQEKDTLLDPKVVDACLKIFKDGFKLLEN